MPQASRFGPVLPLALLLGATAAHATTMVPQTLQDLATVSSAVVHATTLDTRAEWRGRMIVTVAHVRIAESLLGALAPGQVVDVVTPGGIVGDRLLIVDGAPRFTPGEDVVLFLTEGLRSAEWQVTDLAQGKFEVVRVGGQETLTRSAMEGVALMSRPAFAGRLSWSDLRQQVRSALRIAR